MRDFLAIVIVATTGVFTVGRVWTVGASSALVVPGLGALLCSDRPAADIDGDCHSDLSDFALLSPCLTGPAAERPPSCSIEHFEISDVDRSGHSDLRDFAGFQRDFGQTGALTIPDDWGGIWQVTLTARNCATMEIVAVDEYEELLCPGAMLADGLIQVFNDCPAAVVGDSLSADCQRSFVVDDCTVRLVVDLDVLRSGETLSGEVQWSGQLEGICDLLGEAPCEVVEVEGLRVSTDTSSCGGGKEP